jgi:hypothetical protein
MNTFKELQDEALSWMADQNDEGLIRTLVKQSIDRTHQRLLTAEQFDFMLWAQQEEFSTEVGRQSYPMHPRFLQAHSFYNETADEWMEEIPAKELQRVDAPTTVFNLGGTLQFTLTGLSHVLRQPVSAAAVVVTASGGTESAANSVQIVGLDELGNEVTEELSSGSAWTTLTSTTTFSYVESVTKLGASWTRAISVTSGSDTLLTLGASEFGKQYRMFELIKPATDVQVVKYRFYRKPRRLVNDNDIPDIPDAFSELLVLDTLLKLQGYSRATKTELEVWGGQFNMLMHQMRQTYQDGRSLGAKPRTIRYIPR